MANKDKARVGSPDRAFTQYSKQRPVVSQQVTRGMLPNNSPIKMRLLIGEKMPGPHQQTIGTDRGSLNTSCLKERIKSRQAKTPNKTFETRNNSILGYKSFYHTKEYHIINHKAIHNEHEMSIQLND